MDRAGETKEKSGGGVGEWKDSRDRRHLEREVREKDGRMGGRGREESQLLTGLTLFGLCCPLLVTVR